MANKKKENIHSEKEEELLFMTLRHMQEREFTQEEAVNFVKILKTGVDQSNNKNLFKVSTMLTGEIFEQ